MTLKTQIAELIAEVRRLREEVAALRAAPSVTYVFTHVPVPAPVYPTWQPEIFWGPVICGTES